MQAMELLMYLSVKKKIFLGRRCCVSLDMLLLLRRHLRYGECEEGFAVCAAGVHYPYKPSLREVGGSIVGFLQAGCWCKRAVKGVPLAI